MGDCDFILANNATVRKAIKKIQVALVEINIEEDAEEVLSDVEMMECLKDEPVAFAYFISLPSSHQNCFSNWV